MRMEVDVCLFNLKVINEVRAVQISECCQHSKGTRDRHLLDPTISRGHAITSLAVSKASKKQLIRRVV